MAADENKTVPLPELHLPRGVTPDTLAKLVTSVLLRHAYCQTYPWAQWLLLATLEILHGHDVPKLDSESLHVLQGTEMKESPVNKGDWTLISNPNMKKDSSKTSSNKECNSQAEVDDENNAKKRKFSHSDDRKEDVNIMNNNNNENTFPCMISGNIQNSSQLISGSIQDSSQFKVSSRKLHVSNSFTRRDFSAQATPKIMRKTCNKWVQVKKFSQIPHGVQTENSFWNVKDIKDCESQTEFKGSPEDSSSTDKETQTVIDKETSSAQYSPRSCFSKPKWKLIPVSGLPRKGIDSKKMELKTNRLSKPERRRDQEKLFIYPLATWKPLDNKSLNPHMITDPTKSDPDSSRKETSLNTDDCFYSLTNRSNILLFHGRPLIRSKSEKDAAGIPLEAMNGLASIMLEDPRQDDL